MRRFLHIGGRTVCATCEGQGEVDAGTYTLFSAPGQSHMKLCPDCDGAGSWPTRPLDALARLKAARTALQAARQPVPVWSWGDCIGWQSPPLHKVQHAQSYYATAKARAIGVAA